MSAKPGTQRANSTRPEKSIKYGPQRPNSARPEKNGGQSKVSILTGLALMPCSAFALFKILSKKSEEKCICLPINRARLKWIPKELEYEPEQEIEPNILYTLYYKFINFCRWAGLINNPKKPLIGITTYNPVYRNNHEPAE